jgi:hypothetical protein
MNSDQIEMLRRITIANAETANLMLKIDGMKAENKMREMRGESLEYDESCFLAEANLNYISNLLQY